MQGMTLHQPLLTYHFNISSSLASFHTKFLPTVVLPFAWTISSELLGFYFIFPSFFRLGRVLD